MDDYIMSLFILGELKQADRIVSCRIVKLRSLAGLLSAILLGGNVFLGTAGGAVPVITTNTVPVTGSDVVGDSVTFRAGFSGTTPISYQWQKNTGSGPIDLPGATNNLLVLTTLNFSDAASPGYSLRASNIFGVATSSPSSFTVNPVPTAANNVIILTANQTGSGIGLFAATWTVASGSLIAGMAPSNVGPGNFTQENAGGAAVLTDGAFGSISNGLTGSHPSFAACGPGAGTSVTYMLPILATNGYDVTNIVVFGGWNDSGRDQQGYAVSYSTVVNPAVFIPLPTVNYNPVISNGVQSATRTAIVSSTTAPLATNVTVVKFDFAASVENGYTGYAELQIFGQPSAPPLIANLPSSLPSSSVYAGTNVTLTEAALGTPPFQYQWQSDDGSGGNTYTDISGANDSNYVVITSSLGNATINYRVRVTDARGGSAISPSKIVTVTDSPISMTTPTNLFCEHLQNPLGIDTTTPRLSWINNLPERGGRQTAFQVLVASSREILNQNVGDLWNSSKIASDQSVLVGYAGLPMISGEACFWKVRVWDENGNASAWSPTATWSMGLLDPSDWSAQWIGMNENTNISPAPPSPMLRKTFSIGKPVVRATAYICGLGYNELQINGAKVGDYVLEPSWTQYVDHAYYTTYDVTTNLFQGQNAIGVQLANGFYNQWTSDAWNTYTAPWRALPQMIMQLVIQYGDGTHDVIISDPSWKTSTGPLVLDTTRLGEVYDARLEKLNWSTANYDDSAWTNAITREGISGSLIAPGAEPVKVFQSVYPVNIVPVSGQPGTYTFDFGQNLAGWGKLTVNGPAGTSVNMIYGELTNSDGSVNQDNINVYVSLKNYFQTDTYILKGGGTETYVPRFTYHGFRYAEVTGLPSVPTTNTLVAQVVHTAFRPAGSFLCSSDLLNRIETNTLRSYLGNFVGLPTDCPTREKNGWDGDAQLACEIGLTHFHSAAAYTRWLKEFGPGQMANGQLSGVFPNANWGYGEGPAWESAVLLIPWFVYEHCGDVEVLTNNYTAMKAYVDYETSVASSNIVSYGLGDWEPASSVTPASVTDTGYYYQDALILARTCALMSNTLESLQYSNLASQIRIAFNRAFYDLDFGEYAGGTQTAQSCALYQGLVDATNISKVAETLAAEVQQNGNTIDTGILGSKYLLRALCDSGHADTAMALALQTNYPGWGNWVLRGATTLWETWNGAGSIDSLNHVMFGDISAWFTEYLAGIRPGSPGYKSVFVKPEITGAISWAQGTHDSPYGKISSAWKIEGTTISLNVTIPPTTTGIIYLPTLGTAGTNLTIWESGTNIWLNSNATGTDANVVYDHSEGSGAQTYSVWDISSGSYLFSWKIVPLPNGLSAQAGNGWVGLKWTPTPGATAYEVKRSLLPGGPYNALATSVLTPEFTDMAVNNGQIYYYVISSLNAGGESASSAETWATPSGLPDSSFETPRVSGYGYSPSGAGWTFDGASPSGSGLVANGSGFENPNAPDGTQAAFVQSHGTVSQSLSGFVPGTVYTITYSAAQRSGDNQHGGESWNVMMDNIVIQMNNPGGTSYVDYAATFTATAARHVLSFVGTDLTTGDNTVFIDRVRISPTIQPQSSSVTLTIPTNDFSFQSSGIINLAAAVVTNGNVIDGVQFYANITNLVGQTTEPYTCLWTNVLAGDYSLIARVIFNGGGIADSVPVNISVTNSRPVVGQIGLGADGQGFSILGTGQPGHTYVLDSAIDIHSPANWLPLLTNLAGTSGNISFTNLPMTNTQQFFRIAAP